MPFASHYTTDTAALPNSRAKSNADSIPDAATLSDAAAVVVKLTWLAGLTVRQREVATLVTHGKSNREIALTLGITYKTVKNHLTHVYDLAGVRSRAELILVALQDGLVDLDKVVVKRCQAQEAW